jgi:hypothetical protein
MQPTIAPGRGIRLDLRAAPGGPALIREIAELLSHARTRTSGEVPPHAVGSPFPCSFHDPELFALLGIS